MSLFSCSKSSWNHDPHSIPLSVNCDNPNLAERYLSRAKNNGLSRVRLERFILNKELREKTIKGLLEIGSLE